MIWLTSGVFLWSAAHLFKRLAPEARARLGNALVLEGERGNAFAKTVDYSQMSARLAALRKRAAKQ